MPFEDLINTPLLLLTTTPFQHSVSVQSMCSYCQKLKYKVFIYYCDEQRMMTDGLILIGNKTLKWGPKFTKLRDQFTQITEKHRFSNLP